MRFLVGKKEMQILSEKHNDNYNKIKTGCFFVPMSAQNFYIKRKKSKQKNNKAKKAHNNKQHNANLCKNINW